MWKNFNESLFKKLNLPFPKLKIKSFGDMKELGTLVSLELDFFLFKQSWVSKIVSYSESDDRYEFIDIGVKLPFFIRKWHHKHVILGSHNQTKIVDEISYSTGFVITDILLYPSFLFLFLYRKPIYKKWFSKNKA